MAPETRVRQIRATLGCNLQRTEEARGVSEERETGGGKEGDGEDWESGRLGKKARGERLGARGAWWEDWETWKTWESGRLRKARGKSVEGAVGLEPTRYALLATFLFPPPTHYQLLTTFAATHRLLLSNSMRQGTQIPIGETSFMW